MSDQPEALRLAEQLSQAAAELRRQHAEIGSSQQAQRDAENELSRTMARHAMAEAELRAERDALHAEIEALKAERDALRAELSEAIEAVDDPAVNNLRTLPEAIRLLCAENAALLSALLEVVRVFESAPSSICDTVWVTGDSAETLYDRCRAAIETERETR